MPTRTPEVASSLLFGGETAVLRQLLGRSMAPPGEGHWSEDFEDGGRAARSTYFLLHRDPQADVLTFLSETLDRLLRQLSCYTEQHSRTYRGQVRGRVLWSETLKSRYAGDYDPSRYVCREVRRRFDMPENQLLLYVLEKIRRAIESVPPVMRFGGCYFPASGDHVAAPIEDSLVEMEGILSRLRSHARLREVELPKVVRPEHLRRAETAKLEEYGQVAALARRYRGLVEEEAEVGVDALAGSVLLLPSRAGGEGDAWIRLAASLLTVSRSGGATAQMKSPSNSPFFKGGGPEKTRIPPRVQASTL